MGVGSASGQKTLIMTDDLAQEPGQDSGQEPRQDSRQDSGQEPGADLIDKPAKPAAGAAEKPRRVPKTLLFNVPTAEAIETYAAAAAAAAANKAVIASGSSSISSSSSSSSASSDAVNTAALEQQAEQEKKQQTAQKQSARRVAKTLLFSEINLDSVKAAAQAASAEPAAVVEAKPASRPSVTGEKKLRKIAKTLQETALGSFGQDSLHAPDRDPAQAISQPQSVADVSNESQGAALEPLPKPVVKPKRQQFVAKTMLDHSILWDTVSKFEAKMELKVAEQLLERANEPIKPFIDIVCKKQATPCSFVWDATDTRERFRYCDLCKTPVYNFTGLEQPEADELIFQRENRRNATLYKRADGKYMTVNCPVEVKRKRDMISMSFAGVLLFIAAIAFMILMPRAPKPEPAQVPTVQPGVTTTAPTTTTISTPATPAASTGAGTGPATGSDDGSFHMVNGQRVYPNNSGAGMAPVNFPAPVQGPAATTDADESGQFWQYDGQPPGTAPTSAPAPQSGQR